MFRYEYLSDSEFLREIDLTPLKTQLVKITVLDRFDQPIKSIEGKVTGGNISVNGNSAIRRSGNISLVADPEIQDVTNIDNLLSINKRVAIEIGFKNIWDKYPTYETIWLPQGIFIPGNPAVSKSTSNFSISFQLKDKMTLLNGEVGGILPCAITHHPIYNEVLDKEPAKIRDILYTLLVTYGDIPEERILIDNVPLRIKNLVRWSGEQSIYAAIRLNNEANALDSFALTYDSNAGITRPYNFFENIGYTYTDFTYPGNELSSNPGEAITSVLDKIKNVLGNYEYFFDINGIFRFQEIKNFINEGSALENWGEALNEKYLINTSETKSVYSFQDANLISAFNNTPQYNAIKNDIIVWGKSTSNLPIRYHLLIDRKPDIDTSKKYNGIVYQTKKIDSNGNILNETDNIYRIGKSTLKSSPKIKVLKDFNNFSLSTDADWRDQLYLDSVLDPSFKSFLSAEVIEEWPKIRNMGYLFGVEGEDIQWNHLIVDSGLPDVTALTYFLDVLDTNTVPSLDWMSISAIGRRPKVINDNQVNCLFEPNLLNVVLIPAGTNETAVLKQEAIEHGELWTQIASYIWKNVSIGGATSSAYDAIRAMLHEITGYNESISVTSMPIYHLEPNTRISVFDEDTGINGDYILKSFNIPLASNGTMTLSCAKAIERI